MEAMRIMVVMLMTALESSRAVPPMERARMLLANQSRVLANRTQRKGMPLMVKIAMVAMQVATTGNQPARLLAKRTPRPMFAARISAPSGSDRKRSARNERRDERSELEQAGRLPSRRKWRA